MRSLPGGFCTHRVTAQSWRESALMQFQPRQLGDHSYFAHLQIDEIDSFYASVLAAGAEISKTIRDEPWGTREFGLVTIDGHRIMFATSKLT